MWYTNTPLVHANMTYGPTDVPSQALVTLAQTPGTALCRFIRARDKLREACELMQAETTEDSLQDVNIGCYVDNIKALQSFLDICLETLEQALEQAHIKWEVTGQLEPLTDS
jgi:hypothetical protein